MQPAEVKVKGHVLIRDAVSGEVLVDRANAVHAENLSEAIALSLADRATGFIQSMAFGNGASTVSGTGAVTYFPPNVTGQTATLYNETYRKVVNDLSPLNTDALHSYIRVNHTVGNTFSDIVVTCLLDYNEPAGEEAFDDATSMDGSYIFDELALYSYDPVSGGRLLTHVVFHPVQKSLNRQIEIVYTLRIYMS